MLDREAYYRQLNETMAQEEDEAKKAAHDAQIEIENRHYRIREEIRSTIVAVCAVLAFLLSVASILWQIPLH